jgi:cellobiose phosphorylase
MQNGYFDDQAKEYGIIRPDMPQSWSNYLSASKNGAHFTPFSLLVRNSHALWL